MTLSERTIEICLNYLKADLEVVKYEKQLLSGRRDPSGTLLKRIEQDLIDFKQAIEELEKELT